MNSEEHSREQEISSTSRQALSFLANETSVSDDVGTAFHSENRVSPTVCIMDLGCTRAMGSRRAVTAFCKYVDAHPDTGLWYELKPTSSRFFFANSQQSTCSEKLVVYMYDYAWKVQNTEFDIVEEGDVPLLMSLPQMRN